MFLEMDVLQLALLSQDGFVLLMHLPHVPIYRLPSAEMELLSLTILLKAVMEALTRVQRHKLDV
jgi:hypothetical protein